MSIEGKPPFDLVQISTLPKSEWKGRAVFHPGLQMGSKSFWSNEDLLPIAVNRAEKDVSVQEIGYDTGVVLDWALDEHGMARVRLVGDSGSTSCYRSWNLWTPRLQVLSDQVYVRVLQSPKSIGVTSVSILDFTDNVLVAHIETDTDELEVGPGCHEPRNGYGVSLHSSENIRKPPTILIFKNLPNPQNWHVMSDRREGGMVLILLRAELTPQACIWKDGEGRSAAVKQWNPDCPVGEEVGAHLPGHTVASLGDKALHCTCTPFTEGVE